MRLVQRAIGVAVPSEYFVAEVGPEFWREIHEAVVGDIDGEVAQDGSAGAAWRRVVKIRKACAHGAPEDVIEVESVSTVIFANDHRTADRVGGAMDEGVSGPFAVIMRILVKGRGNHEISEEVLGGDIGIRCSKPFGECFSVRAVLGVAVSQLRKDRVEGAASGRQRACRLVEEVVPSLVGGVDCLFVGGELDGILGDERYGEAGSDDRGNDDRFG